MAGHGVKLVERIYDAFFRGDLDGVMACCAPDATIVQDAALPWGGTYVGRDGVAEFAQRLMGTCDTTVTTEAVFEAGDRVVQYGRSHGTVRATGARYDVPECHVWALRDGVVVGVEFYIDSDAMLTILQGAPAVAS